jgi:predicted site-specific integrase-resolvase
MKFLVHSQEEDNGSRSQEEELRQDLFAVIDVFTARKKGRHAAKSKKRRTRNNR